MVADLQLGDVTVLVELVEPELVDVGWLPNLGPGICVTLAGKGGRTQPDLVPGEAYMIAQALAETMAADGAELLHRALMQAAAT